MPEVKHAMRAAGKKARAVNDVGASFNQRLQQHRVLCRIVLEIGVLDDDEVPLSFANDAIQGRTFPHVLRLKAEFESGEAPPAIVQGSPMSRHWIRRPRKSIRSPAERQALCQPLAAAWHVRCTPA